METTPVYSIPDLKSVSDDALPNFLSSKGFRRSHTLSDIRLGLGISTVVVAAMTFAYDYQLGWEPTKHYTLWTVILYFALNLAYNAWIYLVEKGTIYIGEKGDRKVSIVSTVARYDPSYNLAVEVENTSKPGQVRAGNIKAPFSDWFTADGHFVTRAFQDRMQPIIRLMEQKS